MYVCIWATTAPKRLVELYAYLVFKRFPVAGRCRVDMDIPSPKERDFGMGFKHKVAYFLKITLT
jgi:hypothetical protein